MRRDLGPVLVLAVIVYSLSLYPTVLRQTERTRYDAPIYWNATRGGINYGIAAPGQALHPGWVYSDRLLPALRPLGRLPYPAFLALLHLGNSLGVAAVLAALLRQRLRLVCAV